MNANNNPNPGLFSEPQKPNIYKTQQEKINSNLLIGQNGQINMPSQGLSQNSGLNLNQNLNQNQQNNSQIGNFSIPNMNNQMNNGYSNSIYDNLMYSNLMLSNWLGSVKSNNSSLYDGMLNNNLTDQIVHKNNLERYIQA